MNDINDKIKKNGLLSKRESDSTNKSLLNQRLSIPIEQADSNMLGPMPGWLLSNNFANNYNSFNNP